MNQLLLLAGVVIVACILMNRIAANSDDRSAGRGSSACAVGSGLDGRDFDRIGHCIYRCSVRI